MLCIFYVMYMQEYFYTGVHFKEYVFVDEVLLNIGRDCCIVLVLMSPFTNKRLEQAHGLHHSFEVTALYVSKNSFDKLQNI